MNRIAKPIGDERLVSARFRGRPNRFVVEAELDSGVVVACHLADPGRLRELLSPGAELRLRDSTSVKRKTRYTVALVRAAERPRSWVGIEPVRANQLAAELLRAGRIPGISPAGPLDREVCHGRSRFDFLATTATGDRIWIEVKSVTLVEEGVALFPDAPTARGRRHLAELTAMVRDGEAAMVLFVVQRGDAEAVALHAGVDPGFVEAADEARTAGVRIAAARFELTDSGGVRYTGGIPLVRRRPLPDRAERANARALRGSGRRRSL